MELGAYRYLQQGLPPTPAEQRASPARPVAAIEAWKRYNKIARTPAGLDRYPWTLLVESPVPWDVVATAASSQVVAFPVGERHTYMCRYVCVYVHIRTYSTEKVVTKPPLTPYSPGATSQNVRDGIKGLLVPLHLSPHHLPPTSRPGCKLVSTRDPADHIQTPDDDESQAYGSPHRRRPCPHRRAERRAGGDDTKTLAAPWPKDKRDHASMRRSRWTRSVRLASSLLGRAQNSVLVGG